MKRIGRMSFEITANYWLRAINTKAWQECQAFFSKRYIKNENDYFVRKNKPIAAITNIGTIGMVVGLILLI